MATLSLAEVCDQRCCPARAAFRVELTAGPLFFCGHHFRAKQDSFAHDPAIQGAAELAEAESS